MRFVRMLESRTRSRQALEAVRDVFVVARTLRPVVRRTWRTQRAMTRQMLKPVPASWGTVHPRPPRKVPPRIDEVREL